MIKYLNKLFVVASFTLVSSVAGAELTAPGFVSDFGSVKNALINIDQLTESQKGELREYLIQLQYQRIQDLNAQENKLGLLQAKQQSEDSITQLQIDSDPDLIIRRRKISREAEIAQNKLLENPPKSLIDTVPFDPSLPQELLLQVYPGFPGAISFFDSTGAPWPILQVKQGSNGAFVSEKMPGNTYSMEAKKYGVSNTGWFVLKGLDTVIPFRISSINQGYFNTRRQVIIPLKGPNAKVQEIVQVSQNNPIDTSKIGPEVYAFLSGTISGVDGAKELEVSGINGQAFQYKDFIYIRTTANLKGRGSSLVSENTLGNYHLYQLYPRAFYWFYFNGERVKGYVRYE